MEPVSQGLLGAAVGQLAAPRLGHRALLWGALVGMAPDLDVLLAPLHGGYGEWLYHRGTTHSLWFGFVAGPLLGWLLWRWRDPQDADLRIAWVRLCVLALVTHPLLDAFTPYGTQLFAPFDRRRFAWHGVGIIDPFYTLILVWAVVAARRAAGFGRRQQRRTAFALGLSTLYLLLGVGLNELALRDVRRSQGPEARVRVYPTLLQPFLRRVVVRDAGFVRVGWHTTFALGCAWWQTFPEPEEGEAARALEASWEGRILRWFALDDVIVRTTWLADGTRLVEMEDLRYGFPGQPPDQSLWGVRARYDAAERRLGPVARFQRDRDAISFDGFLALTLGRFRDTRLAGEHPDTCSDTRLALREGGDVGERSLPPPGPQASGT